MTTELRGDSEENIIHKIRDHQKVGRILLPHSLDSESELGTLKRMALKSRDAGWKEGPDEKEKVSFLTRETCKIKGRKGYQTGS